MLPLPGPPLLAPRSFPLSGIDRSVFKHRLENHRLSLFRRDREGRARREGEGKAVEEWQRRRTERRRFGWRQNGRDGPGVFG